MRGGSCPVCGTRGLVPVSGPRCRSTLSDGAPVGVAVARLVCRRCGIAVLASSAARRLPRRLYGTRYGLNAETPSPLDIARHKAYAARIVALAGGAPDSVLDVGCGNGALLKALSGVWPKACLSGVEWSLRRARRRRPDGWAFRFARR